MMFVLCSKRCQTYGSLKTQNKVYNVFIIEFIEKKTNSSAKLQGTKRELLSHSVKPEHIALKQQVLDPKFRNILVFTFVKNYLLDFHLIGVLWIFQLKKKQNFRNDRVSKCSSQVHVEIYW